MGAFLGLWALQIVVSIGILAMVPKRPDLPEKINRNRDIAWKVGFIPCVGIMLIYQVIFLAWYYFSASREDSKRGALQEMLPTTGFTPQARPSEHGPSTDNPFGTSEPATAPDPGPQSPKPPAADNPFA